MRIRKAVFPAAGLGTRFLPATKAQPKEMLSLVDKPLIQYVIEEAVAAGLTKIVIVTGADGYCESAGPSCSNIARTARFALKLSTHEVGNSRQTP